MIKNDNLNERKVLRKKKFQEKREQEVRERKEREEKELKNIDENDSWMLAPDMPTEKERWKIPKMNKSEHKVHLTEESSFQILFPRSREDYFKLIWPRLSKIMSSDYGIELEIDFFKGTMGCHTTPNTWDPYAIIQARDVLRLLARYVPYEQAFKAMKDDITYEIVDISNFCPKKETFEKRRARIVGPDGYTLKALEIVSGCYVLVQGKTVVVIGHGISVLKVKSIIEDTMNNIHPIYGIKKLMIERELAKNGNMTDKNWTKFLPQYKKSKPIGPVRAAQRKKEKQIKQSKKRKEKEYTPFPPAPTPRQVDLQLESGEYFANQKNLKKQKQIEKIQEKKKNREDKSKMKQLEKIQKATTFSAPKKDEKRSEESIKDIKDRISKNISSSTHQKRKKNDSDFIQKKSKFEK